MEGVPTGGASLKQSKGRWVGPVPGPDYSRVGPITVTDSAGVLIEVVSAEEFKRRPAGAGKKQETASRRAC